MKIPSHIEIRLKNWGKWRVKSWDNGLGYPSATTIIKLLRQRHPMATSNYVLSNPDAEEIDELIREELVMIDPLAAYALIHEYTDSGTQAEKAQEMDMSRHRYLRLLGLAKMYLTGKLSYELSSSQHAV